MSRLLLPGSTDRIERGRPGSPLTHCADRRIRVADACLVGDARLRVLVGEQRVSQRAFLARQRPRYPARAMLPKVMARVGQAAWQAVSTSSAPIGRLSRSASIRAAAIRCRQNVHFSITPRARTVTSGLRAIRRPLLFGGEGEVVEAANLVGTVVGAEPRADATVVDHHVQPFLIVHGGANGADDFARRLLAMLAQHRLEQNSRVPRARLRSSDRCAASASRARGSPAACRRPECCSRPCRRRRRRCSRCRR